MTDGADLWQRLPHKLAVTAASQALASTEIPSSTYDRDQVHARHQQQVLAKVKHEKNKPTARIIHGWSASSPAAILTVFSQRVLWRARRAADVRERTIGDSRSGEHGKADGLGRGAGGVGGCSTRISS